MHRIRCKIVVSIKIAIYSLGKIDKQHSEASTMNTVQYSVVRLWITQPIKQPQHRAHGNSRPQRTQLLLWVCWNRGRSKAKTRGDTFLKRGQCGFPLQEVQRFLLLSICNMGNQISWWWCFQRIMVFGCLLFLTGKCLVGISTANFLLLHKG